MHIGVLSTKKTFYSTRRILMCIRERGHIPHFIDPLRCQILVNGNTRRIVYRGKPLPFLDIVLTRIGPAITDHGVALVRQLEFSGIKVLNTSRAIMNSRDKMHCLQLLAGNNIRIPPTVLTRDSKAIAKLIKSIGGPPVILKTLQGTQGLGVMLAESIGAAAAMIDTFLGLNQSIMLQQYIAESQGEDLRVFVLGDKILAGMKRKARPPEFRSNIHRGGKGEYCEVPVDIRKIVTKAAKVLGLNIAGIDVLKSLSGPLILEANSSPGFQELEKISGLDIAGKITDFLIETAGED